MPTFKHNTVIRRNPGRDYPIFTGNAPTIRSRFFPECCNIAFLKKIYALREADLQNGNIIRVLQCFTQNAICRGTYMGLRQNTLEEITMETVSGNERREFDMAFVRIYNVTHSSEIVLLQT